MITPQEKNDKIKKALKINADLYFKREDKHPFGSHKGRSLPIMIARHIKSGWRDFVISSSGNAAIAAAHAIKKYNIDPRPISAQGRWASGPSLGLKKNKLSLTPL